MEKLFVARTSTSRGASTFSVFFKALLLIILLSGTARAATVMLEWDPSPDADLAGYRVYYQADSAVQPFQGLGASEGTSPVEGGAATSATISGLDPGRSYYFAVTAYNSAGLESVYSNVIQIKESVPPSVNIVSPVASTTTNGLVIVKAMAADNSGVEKVQFLVNGALAAEDGSAPYEFSWDTSPLARGSYALTAKAVDAAGNEAISGSVTVAVTGDTTPPVVTILPVVGSRVSGTVAVSATATDDTGVTMLELYVDGSPVLTGNESSVGYNWNTLALQNGSHLITVRAFDAAGNSTVASSAVQVENPVAVTLTLAHAEQALMIASGKVTATAADLTQLDVAPYIDGQSRPNGRVDTGDVVVILSKLVGKL